MDLKLLQRIEPKRTRRKNFPKFRILLIEDKHISWWFQSKQMTSIVIDVSEKNRELLRHLVTQGEEQFKLIPIEESE